MSTTNKSDFLTYKGKPLVRNGNTMYYGNMSDPFVVIFQINTTKTFKDMEIANKVTIQLVNTDPNIRPRDRIIKKSEKNGLYAAMDIGSIWLERALKSE